MENQSKEYMKYENGRKCKACAKPIADHIHATTEYCEKIVFPDGSIKSCRDDYNAEKRRIDNQFYNELMSFHKTTTLSIERLVREKGDTVTTADLNFYQIALNRAAKTELLQNKMVLYFINFKLTQINETQFKITTHDNAF